MAFALVGYHARGIDIAGPSYKRGIQQVVFQITATTADVDLDIGDSGGTFWTESLADATYGGLATKALESLTRIAGQAVGVLAVEGPELVDRYQIGTLTGAGQKTIAIDTLGPNIEFNAADGEESLTVIVSYELDNHIFPEVCSYG